MANGFVASCNKGIEQFRAWVDEKIANSERTIRLKGGGKVTLYGLNRMAKQSVEPEPEYRRITADKMKSNIYKERQNALRSQLRDAYFEKLLQEEQFVFPNMFMTRNPFGEAPLTAMVLFVTEHPCGVRVTVKGDIPETNYTYTLPVTRHHRVPVLGLYAKRKNQVLIELLDEKNNVFDQRVVPIRTKALPPDLRNVITVKKKPENPAFKTIMIAGGVDIKTCAFDVEGKIRYYLRRNVRGYGIFPLKSGRFLYMERIISTPSYSNPQTIISHDMDYMGRVFKTYMTERGIHHTVEEMPNDNFLAGSNTMLEHTEDEVVEIDRKTGEIIWNLKIEDLFDDTYKDMMDWAHVNSASYNPKDNSIIISLRNIHSIISVDYTTKELRWLFADPEFWAGTPMVDKLLKPVGDVKWCYQQHSAFELDEDFDGNPDTKHIIVFDNHWAVRRPAASFDGDELTYVSFYTINEKEGTVSLYKRFPCPKARIRSNGIYCPEEGRVYSMAGSYTTPVDGDKGGIFEYDFETGEVLAEFGVKPGYFRAYEFAPDFEELAKPVPKEPNYLVGSIKSPRKLEKEDWADLTFDMEVFTPIGRKIRHQMREDIYMVHGIDHEIRKIYFVSEDDVYVVEYDQTYQTMDIFKDNEYYIPMQISNLPVGHYDIYLDVTGEIGYTKKYLEIYEDLQKILANI